MAAVRMALVAVGALPLVAGHGSVLFPPTRNAIDSELEPWRSATIAGGKQQFPYTGHWKYMPFGCDCTNGTEPCMAGQGCASSPPRSISIGLLRAQHRGQCSSSRARVSLWLRRLLVFAGLHHRLLRVRRQWRAHAGRAQRLQHHNGADEQ